MAADTVVGCALIENPAAFFGFIGMGMVFAVPWIFARMDKLTREDEE